MARPRTIADATIFAAILRVIALEGDGAVTFGAVARATGVAAATLAQRVGTRDAAWFVDVFDSDEPFAVVAVRVEPRGDGGDEGPEV